jgi:predicted Zn-dependent peptidase
LCALIVLFSLSLLLISPHFCLAASNAPVAPPLTVESAPGFGLGPVTAYTLPNGLKVLVAPSNAADLVTLDVWVNAGTRRETAENNGAAHFMEHLLFKGTPTREPGEIDAAIEDLGGNLDAATSYDWAHFYVTIAAEDAGKALAVLSDAVMHASLRQKDMDTERQVILDERARELSSPDQRTLEAADALCFPGHPYGRPLLGTLANITAMTRETVVDFYKAYYVPGDTTLVIAGNISPEGGLALAREYFGVWPAHAAPPDKTPSEQPQTERRIRTLYGGTSQGYLTLAFHAPSVADTPDAWVMDVLLTWLGQGGVNHLQEDLKKKDKLVTNISSNYLTQRDPGLLTITASFAPGTQDQVTSALLAEIDGLRQNTLSPEDVNAAKHALLASYLFDAETDSGRADALGFYNTIDTYKYDTEYIDHILSVTPQQIQQAAQTYLDPRAYTLVTLLPRVDPIEASGRRAAAGSGADMIETSER